MLGFMGWRHDPRAPHPRRRGALPAAYHRPAVDRIARMNRLVDRLALHTIYALAALLVASVVLEIIGVI